jgi:hypothetical protein
MDSLFEAAMRIRLGSVSSMASLDAEEQLELSLRPAKPNSSVPTKD